MGFCFSFQLEDSTLQLYKHNGTHSEYGSYLDIESTLTDQSEEMEGFLEKWVLEATWTYV